MQNDNDNQRGKILYRDRAQQLRDFSGLRYGKITPTDIDAFLEFTNKLFIFVEIKGFGARMPYGQRLAIQRLVNACKTSHKEAYAFVCEHEQHDSSKDIDAANTMVVSYYKDNRWREPSESRTLKQSIDLAIQKAALASLHLED